MTESKYEQINQIILEITTGGKRKNATDDAVTLDIGGHSWELDLPKHDDFERGQTDRYELEVPKGMDASWFRFLCFKKKGDLSRDDDWLIEKVKLTINGKVVYEKDNLNALLKVDQNRWCAPDFSFGKAGE